MDRRLTRSVAALEWECRLRLALFFGNSRLGLRSNFSFELLGRRTHGAFNWTVVDSPIQGMDGRFARPSGFHKDCGAFEQNQIASCAEPILTLDNPSDPMRHLDPKF